MAALMGRRRRGCRGLGLHRLERLGLDANAGAGLGNDVLGDIVGRLGCVEASGVHLDKHRQVHTSQDRPTGVGVEQTADLVEGGAAPQIDEEQDVLGIVEGKRPPPSTFWRKSSGPMLGIRETVATLG